MTNKIKLNYLKEVIVFIGIVILSYIVIPISIYIVGSVIIDDYCSDPMSTDYCFNGGINHLYQSIWKDILLFEPSAWLLISSPYFIILLIRSIIYINRQ
ncbi:MAG: hypothetical protein VYC50_00190 [Pseudomonadota bacterium]|nr:hypothetical protein [Gammaproteobacteria bacterium]MEE2683510.1 hypothetical protein [Pseudomonadota bacterium]